MHAFAHTAELNARLPDGSTVRDSLCEKVKRAERKHGNGSAEHVREMAKLDGPPYPVSLQYLLDWSDDLYGRTGITPDGTFAPLTWRDIESWARMTDRRPLPHEVRALMALDAARRAPAAGGGQ